MTLVQNLLSCMQHMVQSLVIDHTPRLIMAQSTNKYNLQQKLWCGALRPRCIFVCHVHSWQLYATNLSLFDPTLFPCSRVAPQPD